MAVVGHGRFADRMARARAGASDPWAQLAAIGQAYVDFAIDEPDVFRVPVGNEYVDPSDPDLAAVRARSERPLCRALADLYGLDPDVADHGPAFLTRVRLSWTCVHGTARLVLDGALRQPTEAAHGGRHHRHGEPALVVPLPLADAAPSP